MRDIHNSNEVRLYRPLLKTPQNAAFTAVSRGSYPVNTTAATIPINLPAAPSPSTFVEFWDYASNFDVNPAYISGNGKPIMGVMDTYALNQKNRGRRFTFVDNIQGWLVSSMISESDTYILKSSDTDVLVNGYTLGRGGGNLITNVVFGSQGMISNTHGMNNTAVGGDVMHSNSTGNDNSAYGYQSMYYNTTGINNTAIGANTLVFNTTTNDNTAIGANALKNNIGGWNNVAVGSGVLANSTTGTANTGVGAFALRDTNTGTYNTAVGASCMLFNTTGNANTAVGQNALRLNTTGSNNLGIGTNTLYSNTTGSGNIAIGSVTATGVVAPVFGHTTENNRISMGHTAITNAYVNVAWTVVSDKRDKTNITPVEHGLAFVELLNPVAYQRRISRDSDEADGPVRYGFLAQEVLDLEGDNPVICDNENPDQLRIVDTALIPVLVKAIQELKADFDAYRKAHP